MPNDGSPSTATGRTLGTWFSGVYAILVGILFFAMQTTKLWRPEAAEAEMAKMPFGRFDWGYVWADTLVPGPALLAGGILLLIRRRAARNLGRLLVFAGFALNLYAMIFFWVGLEVVGQPLAAGELWMNLAFTILGVLVMIHVALQAMREGRTIHS
ncbi:MAG: hypothetical protein KJ726_11340 [Verrucomicrobia bacterium]|nr:hypothetical protein [Verrucomicrobiota bacterium]MBU1910632.1 hypothetical protein [Verrucomicrobiota bacterium]